jgi:hypothetical protein
MKALILVALAFASIGRAGELPAEELAQAKVTLPFAEVRALLEAARPKPAVVPPIASAIAAGRVSFAFADKTSLATADFEVEVLASGWQLVPLVGTSLPVIKVTPVEATVLPKDGMLCLLASQPGRARVTIEFEIPSALAQSGAHPILLNFAPVAAGRLEVKPLPAPLRAVLRHGALLGGDGTMALPVNGGQISVDVTEDKPVLPTAWRSNSLTLIVQRDDRLLCESRIHLTGDAGSGLSAQLSLPAEASRINFSGPDIRSTEPPRLAASGRIAVLSWETPDLLVRDLTVRYELPAPPAGGQSWRIQPPRIGDEKETGRTIIVPLPGVTLAGEGVRSLSTGADLPDWIMKISGAGPSFEVNSSVPFVISAQILPKLEVDTARIPEAAFRTRIVTDGSQLCEARLKIQHRESLRWRFSLPKGSELLSCEVGANASSPIVLGDGRLELAIPQASAGDRSEIAFSYTSRGSALAPVEGKLSLVLPSTPIFIENLIWDLALPESFESTAFEGNVEPEGGGRDIRFRKRLVRNEAASVEIYYRKRNANR